LKLTTGAGFSGAGANSLPSAGATSASPSPPVSAATVAQAAISRGGSLNMLGVGASGPDPNLNPQLGAKCRTY